MLCVGFFGGLEVGRISYTIEKRAYYYNPKLSFQYDSTAVG